MASSALTANLIVVGNWDSERRHLWIGPVRRDAATAMSLTLKDPLEHTLVPELALDTEADASAAKVVLVWMDIQYEQYPIPPIALDEVEEMMGPLDVAKVLKIYRVLEALAIKHANADQLLRHWLLHEISVVGITAAEIEEVWDVFPLAKYPASTMRVFDLRPRLLEAMNKVEEKKQGFYTDESQLRELLGRREDFRTAWEATWRSYPPWWYRSDEAVTRRMLDSKENDEPRVRKSTKIQWWLSNLREGE